MAMSAARYGSLYRKSGGYTRQSSQSPQPSLGDIMLKAGRAEAQGVMFNKFPQIGARLPGILGAIVVETTEAVFARARALAPVAKVQHKGDPEPGTLRDSAKIRYSKSKRTGAVVTGRIDWKARDPYAGHPDHEYPFFVEVGSVTTRAQPFAIPALIAERPEFNRKLRTLESRL